MFNSWPSRWVGVEEGLVVAFMDTNGVTTATNVNF